MKVEELNLSNRTYNAIKRKGIATVEELSQMTEGQIKSIRNIGLRSYLELIHAMELNGYPVGSKDFGNEQLAQINYQEDK